MADGKRGGVDWGALMKIIAPVVGDLATKGGDGAFMSGFLRAQERGQAARREREQEDQRRRAAGSQFMLSANEALQQITDPIEFENTAALYDDAGAQTGYHEPGALKSRLKFSDAKRAEAQLKELTDELAKYDRYDLDRLIEAGEHAKMTLPSGQKLSFATAAQMTRARPTDAHDEPILSPAKPPAVPPRPPDRSLVESQFDDLVSLWQEGHPGQEPPPSIRTQLRSQAQKEIGQADDRPVAPRGAGGLTDAQEFSMEERLARAWTSASQSLREMTRQHALMQTGLKRFRQGDKNGGSQAVLVTFQKMLDPTSVVRESEYARTASGQSLLNRIEGYADRLSAGGAGMTDGELAAMVETARQFLTDMQASTSGTRRRLENQAKSKGLAPANIFDDVLTGETVDPATSARDKLNRR